jgi:hypothetical protein
MNKVLYSQLQMNNHNSTRLNKIIKNENKIMIK